MNHLVETINLRQLEKELKRRIHYPYKWGMIQNDYYDNLTNFVYNIFRFDSLVEYLEKQFKGKLPQDEYDIIFNYALNRWYNFWSAVAVEKIFCCLPRVKSAPKYDRERDFFINGIPFDHKTTVYPKKYPLTIEEAIQNKKHLIEWLYLNQSREQRFHLKNRLFIVLYSSDLEHWKLKAEISIIKKKNY